jgi:hypothetical protein
VYLVTLLVGWNLSTTLVQFYQFRVLWVLCKFANYHWIITNLLKREGESVFGCEN